MIHRRAKCLCVCVRACDWDNIEYADDSRSHSHFISLSSHLYISFNFSMLSKCGRIWILLCRVSFHCPGMRCTQARALELLPFVNSTMIFRTIFVIIHQEKSKMLKITRVYAVIIQNMLYSIHRIPNWASFFYQHRFAFWFRHFFDNSECEANSFSLDIFLRVANLVTIIRAYTVLRASLSEFRNGKFLWKEIAITTHTNSLMNVRCSSDAFVYRSIRKTQ